MIQNSIKPECEYTRIKIKDKSIKENMQREVKIKMQ